MEKSPFIENGSSQNLGIKALAGKA
jgi:hypothetical protein